MIFAGGHGTTTTSTEEQGGGRHELVRHLEFGRANSSRISLYPVEGRHWNKRCVSPVISNADGGTTVRRKPQRQALVIAGCSCCQGDGGGQVDKAGREQYYCW